MDGCELCQAPGGEVVWKDSLCRVIRIGGVEGVAFPSFCRVVWHAHTSEMSDLPARERRHLMNVVFAVEAALRTLMKPDKINLASLGNVVPHLHWHVIPRWTDDSHFPAPVWAEAKRAEAKRNAPPDRAALHAAITAALAEEQ
ncbi:MAG: HIT family protein [Rhodocyclaceae bacterium]|nr:HIT family protein [Rhodocyclaceae bacterium]